MANSKGSKASSPDERTSGGSKSKDAKVADIRTGSRTLAEAADFSEGYGETMQHHINRGSAKPSGQK